MGVSDVSYVAHPHQHAYLSTPFPVSSLRIRGSASP